MHIQLGNRARLNALHVLMLIAESPCLFCGYLPLVRWFIDKVKLVANQHYAETLLSLVHQWLQPELHIFKGLALCDVVDDESTQSFTIVRHCDSPILLLTCSVPQLCLHCGPILHSYVLCRKLHSDCGADRFRQLVFEVARQQACFSNEDVANQDNCNKDERNAKLLLYRCSWLYSMINLNYNSREILNNLTDAQQNFALVSFKKLINFALSAVTSASWLRMHWMKDITLLPALNSQS